MLPGLLLLPEELRELGPLQGTVQGVHEPAGDRPRPRPLHRGQEGGLSILRPRRDCFGLHQGILPGGGDSARSLQRRGGAGEGDRSEETGEETEDGGGALRLREQGEDEPERRE